MKYIIIATLLLISYLIGSIPFGLIIGKIVKKVDVRKFGSKNIGTTNTTRIVGIKWGLLVFLLDMLKGSIIIIFVRLLFQTSNELLMGLSKINEIIIYPLYGLSAVLGHVFPVYLKFKGGKAVATSFGVILSIAPLISITGTVIFGLILLITKYVSLASLITSSFILLEIFVYDIFFEKNDYLSLKFFYESKNFYIYSVEIICTIILVLIIFIRHRSNLYRLFVSKDEPKVSFSKNRFYFYKKIK